MALPQPKTYYLPEAYLALERAAEFKSEFFDGEIVAMAGESLNHGRIKSDTNRIIGNLFTSVSIKYISMCCPQGIGFLSQLLTRFPS